MAAAGITPGTEGLQALREEWEAEFKTKPNEEAVVTRMFDSPKGVSKIGEKLNIRIVPVITSSTLATTAQGQGSSINYHTGTILNVTVDPTFAYGIVEIPDHLVSKLTDSDSSGLKAAYRSQLMKMLQQKVDEDGGALAASVSTQKGAPSNFDKTLLLDALGTLRENAKEFVKEGTPMYLCYHPSQIKHVGAIDEITNAYLRGDGTNPNVKGPVHITAWGLDLDESGNVFQDAGVTYNLLHAPQGFVKGYNVMPKLKDPQDYEFVVRIPAYCEFGVAAVFDEAAVAIKSAA